jgi:cytoskeletal protein RodZ
MQSNITEQQYPDGLLSEPHFDEEATILSARPVVPLHEIQATERSSKRLTFGLALIAALMIGALGATLIYRQRGQIATTETVDTAVPETSQNTKQGNEAAAGASVSDAGGGASETPASAVAVSPPKTSDAPASEWRDSAAARPRKSATTVVQSPVKSAEARSIETQRDEVSDPEAIRAQRRAERIEARRQRRQAQREAWGEVRSRRVQRTDDLLRIRDIFEGPRRPPRFQRWQ